MKEKIFAIIAVFLLVSSPALAACPDPNDPTCPTEPSWDDMGDNEKFTSNWQRAFEESTDKSADFNRPEVPKTSENLGKVPTPTLENFKAVPVGEQAKYIEDKYNPNFAEDFFSTRQNKLSDAPTAANTFLQDKFGNSKVNFKAEGDMRFSDNPARITAGGVTLSKQPGAGSIGIPEGATSVSFNYDKNEFVFDPRGLEVQGQRITLNNDGSFTFDNAGSIIDPSTGSTIDIEAGSNLKFSSDGVVIQGPAEGKVRELQFENFAGTLTITGTVVSSEDSHVTTPRYEINGKFVVNLYDGSPSHVSLLTDDSSYKDSNGMLRGQADIEFYRNRNWRNVKTNGPCEMEYGPKLRDDANDRKHLFGGEFEASFDENGNPSNARLLNKGSSYTDKENHIDVTHIHNAVNVHFGTFDKEQRNALISNLGEGESIVALGPAEEIFGYGQVGIGASSFGYAGLQDSASILRAVDGPDETIKIDSSEDGNVASFTKKFKVGDLLLDDGFVSGENSVKTIVARENGELTLKISKDSLALLAALENSQTSFALISHNLLLELGENERYFFGTDLTQRYESDGKGSVTILSPKNTHFYLGNDVDTIKGIVTRQAQTGEQGIDVQLLSLSKILDLRGREIASGEYANKLESYIQSFEETKRFIENAYSDELQRKIMMSSFMIEGVGLVSRNGITRYELGRQNFVATNEDEKRYQEFARGTVSELGRNMVSNDEILGPSKGVGTMTNPQDHLPNDILQALVERAQTDPEAARGFGKLLEHNFQNRIAYENMVEGYGLYEGKYYGASTVEQAYRALIIMEDISISDIGEEVSVTNNPQQFSTKKMNLMKGLAAEYARHDRLASAIAIADQLERNYNEYLNEFYNENSQQLSYAQESAVIRSGSIMGFSGELGPRIVKLGSMEFDTMMLSPDMVRTIVALEDLRGNVENFGYNVAGKGFWKIQMDLMTQAKDIEAALDPYKTAMDRLRETGVFDENYFRTTAEEGTFEAGLERVGGELMRGIEIAGRGAIQGGWGKDIIRAVGGFDHITEAAEQLEGETRSYSRGAYAIESLYGHNLPPDMMEDWMDGKLNDEEGNPNDEGKLLAIKLLEQSGRATGNPIPNIEMGTEQETGRPIFEVAGERYAVAKSDLEIVLRFLEDSREDARKTYYSKAYGEDIRTLIGAEDVLYIPGDYYSVESLGLDMGIQRSELQKRLEQSVPEFSTAEKVLDFIDEGMSPGVVALSLITGGVGGTFFSSATGVSGAALGLVENVIIDAAAGTILVASGVDPKEHPWLAMGVSMGVGVGTGIPRIGKALYGAATKSTATSIDDYAKAIARAGTGLESKTDDIARVLRSLNSEQLGSPSEIARSLSRAGIVDDMTTVTGAVSKLQLDTAVKDLDLAAVGLSRRMTSDGVEEIVDGSGRVIRNLDQLGVHVDEFYRVAGVVADADYIPARQAARAALGESFEEGVDASRRSTVSLTQGKTKLGLYQDPETGQWLRMRDTKEGLFMERVDPDVAASMLRSEGVDIPVMAQRQATMNRLGIREVDGRFFRGSTEIPRIELDRAVAMDELGMIRKPDGSYMQIEGTQRYFDVDAGKKVWEDASTLHLSEEDALRQIDSQIELNRFKDSLPDDIKSAARGMGLEPTGAGQWGYRHPQTGELITLEHSVIGGVETTPTEAIARRAEIIRQAKAGTADPDAIASQLFDGRLEDSITSTRDTLRPAYPGIDNLDDATVRAGRNVQPTQDLKARFLEEYRQAATAEQRAAVVNYYSRAHEGILMQDLYDTFLPYNPHGSMHTEMVVRKSLQTVNDNPQIQQALIDQFRQTASGRMRSPEELQRTIDGVVATVAEGHDLGYAYRFDDRLVKKGIHAETSAEALLNMKGDVMARFDLTEDQFQAIHRAVLYHGADNPLKEGKDLVTGGVYSSLLAEGKMPYTAADISRDPLLAIVRTADNLDMSAARLKPWQRSSAFEEITERLYTGSGNPFRNADGAAITKSAQIPEAELDDIFRRNPVPREQEAMIREMSKAGKFSDFDYPHFRGAIAVSDASLKGDAFEVTMSDAFKGIRESESNMPAELYQAWRLKKSVDTVNPDLPVRFFDSSRRQIGEMTTVFELDSVGQRMVRPDGSIAIRGHEYRDLVTGEIMRDFKP